MSTQLATISEEQQALLQSGGLGLPDMQLKPAEMVLVQRTSRTEGATPGRLRDNLTGTEYSEIRVVPLMVRSGRVLFPPGSDLDAKPLCRSNDGIGPVTTDENLVPQAPNCATCDFGNKAWAKGKRPDCRETRRFLFIEKETQLPYVMTIKGTSLKAFKDLLSGIARYMAAARAKGETLNLFDFSFTIKSRFEQNSKGSYYVLQFPDLKRVATPGEFGPLYFQFVRLQETLQEEEANVDEAVDTNFVEA